MDPVTTVVVGAAGALANAIATDGWAAVKAVVMKIFRRAGKSEAELADAELTALEELARSGGDLESVRSAAYAAWLTRFRRLLESNPELAGQLRDELGAAKPAATGDVRQYNQPTGHGIVIAPIHGNVNWHSPRDDSR